MTRPRLLDLFSGAGGSAVGYARAGFDVVGVDLHPQPNYPFRFVQGDALSVLRGRLGSRSTLCDFDAIHASPPCQAYSVLRHANDREYPDLVAPTRELLEATGLPYVIENVVGAPLINPALLCGSSFGLSVRRHRLFETNWPLLAPPCVHQDIKVIGVYGGGPGKRVKGGRRGGYQGTVAEKRTAMDIDWMTTAELNQAIPPAYTELIGHQLAQWIRTSKTPTEGATA